MHKTSAARVHCIPVPPPSGNNNHVAMKGILLLPRFRLHFLHIFFTYFVHNSRIPLFIPIHMHSHRVYYCEERTCAFLFVCHIFLSPYFPSMLLVKMKFLFVYSQQAAIWSLSHHEVYITSARTQPAQTQPAQADFLACSALINITYIHTRTYVRAYKFIIRRNSNPATATSSSTRHMMICVPLCNVPHKTFTLRQWWRQRKKFESVPHDWRKNTIIHIRMYGCMYSLWLQKNVPSDDGSCWYIFCFLMPSGACWHFGTFCIPILNI